MVRNTGRRAGDRSDKDGTIGSDGTIVSRDVVCTHTTPPPVGEPVGSVVGVGWLLDPPGSVVLEPMLEPPSVGDEEGEVVVSGGGEELVVESGGGWVVDEIGSDEDEGDVVGCSVDDGGSEEALGDVVGWTEDVGPGVEGVTGGVVGETAEVSLGTLPVVLAAILSNGCYEKEEDASGVCVCVLWEMMGLCGMIVAATRAGGQSVFFFKRWSCEGLRSCRGLSLIL